MLTMNPLWRDPAIRNVVQARASHHEPVLRNKVSLTRLATTQPLQMVQRLVAQRAVLRPQSHAPSTLAKYASADTYFYEFASTSEFLSSGSARRPPREGTPSKKRITSSSSFQFLCAKRRACAGSPATAATVRAAL